MDASKIKDIIATGGPMITTVRNSLSQTAEESNEEYKIGSYLLQFQVTFFFRKDL